MDGEKVELVGEQGALLLNLDGYLADNRDSQPEWERALQELDNQHVPGKISTFDVVYAIEQAANDERIKGLVLDLNYFEGADIPALEYVGESNKQSTGSVSVPKRSMSSSVISSSCSLDLICNNRWYTEILRALSLIYAS